MDDRTPATTVEPENDGPMPLADRVFGVISFALICGLFMGVVSVVVASWEALKNVLWATLLGEPVGKAASGWVWIVGAGTALGVLAGAWLGWDTTRAKRRGRPAAGPQPAGRIPGGAGDGDGSR